MFTFKPVRFSLWLFTFGVSFGMALNAGWLILLGLVLPIAVLGGAVLLYLLRNQ